MQQDWATSILFFREGTECFERNLSEEMYGGNLIGDMASWVTRHKPFRLLVCGCMKLRLWHNGKPITR